MLNIELVRFEAQDVITASVMKPHKPQKPVVIVPPTEPTVPHEHSYKRVVVGTSDMGGDIVQYVCDCGEVKKF